MGIKGLHYATINCFKFNSLPNFQEKKPATVFSLGHVWQFMLVQWMAVKVGISHLYWNQTAI